VAVVVGVVFPHGTKTYYFDPAGLELSRGDKVVVQTANGPEIGQVVDPPHSIDDAELPAPLKKVTRLATGKDLEIQAASLNVRKEALAVCRQLIAAHGLDMKLVGAEVSFGGDKITFTFTAEERVDFRALVADLAKTLKTRIELRQVGAREEARLLGGLGPCGRPLCCTLFPPDEEPVSIRMAKEQNLPLNPSKISGLCGRLMCCLKYEQEQYVQFRKEAPPKGTPVSTPVGEGVVSGYDYTKESLLVKLEDGTTTAVRLDTCHYREDGGLLVVPVEPEPVTLAPALTETLVAEESESEESLAEVEGVAEELAVVEAELVVGADGQTVEVIVEETTRPEESRRGRGRRRGPGRRSAGSPVRPGPDKGAATEGDIPKGEAASESAGSGGPGSSVPADGAARKAEGGERAMSRARRKRRGDQGSKRRRGRSSSPGQAESGGASGGAGAVTPGSAVGSSPEDMGTSGREARPTQGGRGARGPRERGIAGTPRPSSDSRNQRRGRPRRTGNGQGRAGDGQGRAGDDAG